MDFKYKQYLNALDNCPPKDCKELSMTAFRWVFEDLNNDNNFKPVLLIKPDRINDKLFDIQEQKCKGFALSLHDSLINSQKAYYYLCKRKKNISNSVGTHVAEVVLVPQDGRGSEFSKSKSNQGHFSFWEYEDTDLSKKIITVAKL